jgi:hypothetical protein
MILTHLLHNGRRGEQLPEMDIVLNLSSVHYSTTSNSTHLSFQLCKMECFAGGRRGGQIVKIDRQCIIN